MIEFQKDTAPNLVFLDIDGTLLDARYRSNDTQLPSLLDRLQSQHYVFGLNSNRSIKDMLPIAERFGITGPIIGENGLFAYIPANQSTEYFLQKAELDALVKMKSTYEKRIFDELKSFFPKQRVLWENVDTVKAISERTISPSYEEGDIIVLNNAFRRFTISAHVLQFSRGNLRHVPAPHMRRFLTKLADSEKEDVTIDYDPKFSNILVSTNKVSKRTAVETVLSRYPQFKLIAIGDSMSDYAMTRGIGRFLAVANASKAVRNVAERISKAPYTLGVKELLEDL